MSSEAQGMSANMMKGSSWLVGGDACGTWAQDMLVGLDNVGGITSRTAAGLCELAGC